MAPNNKELRLLSSLILEHEYSANFPAILFYESFLSHCWYLPDVLLQNKHDYHSLPYNPIEHLADKVNSLLCLYLHFHLGSDCFGLLLQLN